MNKEKEEIKVEKKNKEPKQVKLSTLIVITSIAVALTILLASITTVIIIKNNNNRISKSEEKNTIREESIRTRQGTGDEGIIISPIIAKPVIYLYPDDTETIEVKVGNPERFTCVYPQYSDGWVVKASPDGTLIDEKTGREYYSLYYEAENHKKYGKALEEGFVVAKNDITSFLEEKLEILGLNAKEAEEFIIYWLPKLEENNYIYVRFQTMEEIEDNMPLSFSKTPDTLIRIMMEWKGLDEYTEVKQQDLIPMERNGFTVVEWGATIIE